MPIGRIVAVASSVFIATLALPSWSQSKVVPGTYKSSGFGSEYEATIVLGSIDASGHVAGSISGMATEQSGSPYRYTYAFGGGKAEAYLSGNSLIIKLATGTYYQITLDANGAPVSAFYVNAVIPARSQERTNPTDGDPHLVSGRVGACRPRTSRSRLCRGLRSQGGRRCRR